MGLEFCQRLDQAMIERAQQETDDRWLLMQTAYTGASRRHGLYQLPAGTGSRIADLGCGFGAAVFEMAEYFGTHVVGFDQNRSRLATAANIREQLDEVRALTRFIEEDITQYVPPTPFDVVTARFVLQYLPIQETLAHWRRWLKRGGCLYIEEIDDGWTGEYPPPPVAWQRVIEAYQAYAKDHGSDRAIGRKLAHELRTAGYTVTRLVWSPSSSLSEQHDADPQVQFERERLLSIRGALIGEQYLSAAEFDLGLQQFDQSYPKMTFITGATVRIWATP